MAGRLEVIRGCMFAGKTAELIRRLREARTMGRGVLAVQHALDTRYGEGVLSTHDGRRFEAAILSDARDLLTFTAGVDVIGVDEVQFFGMGFLDVAARLNADGKRLIVAGIDHDIWGRDFDPLPALVARADEDTLLCAACATCGGEARYSQRVLPLVDGKFIGGPEAYSPRCNACFQPYTCSDST